MPWPGDLELVGAARRRSTSDMAAARALAGAAGAEQPGAGRALARDRAALRRDGRHRHQPARRGAGRRRRRAARRPGDRDADEPSRLRRRGRCAANEAQRGAFAAVAGKVAGAAAEPRQQRRHLPRRGLCVRSHPARPRALWRRAAARGGGAYPPGRACRGADRPAPPGRGRPVASAMAAPSPPSGACELAILNIGYADGYLRGFSGTGRARIGDDLRAGRRPGLDGPDRDPRRRGAGAAGATGSSSITTCRPRPPSRGSANMSC